MDALEHLKWDAERKFRESLYFRGIPWSAIEATAHQRDDRPLEVQAGLALAFREMEAFVRQQFKARDLAKTLEQKPIPTRQWQS